MQHHINYTPLTHHGRSTIGKVKRFISNGMLGLSLLFLFVSLSFLIFTLFTTKDQKISTASQASAPYTQLSPRLPLNKLSEISFIPTHIDEYTFSEDMASQIQTVYPSLTSVEIQQLAIKSILTWSALRDYYAKNNSENIALSPQTTDVTYNKIKQETDEMERLYQPRVLTISGVFFKVRFGGIYPQNVEALGNKTQLELRTLAQQKIEEILTLAKQAPDPAFLLEPIMLDYELSLMNNNEPMEQFHNNNFDPPLFDDPNLFDIIKALPVKEFSPTLTLQTYNPGISTPQEYAYVVFYLTEKTGELPPIIKLVDDYIKNANIR